MVDQLTIDQAEVEEGLAGLPAAGDSRRGAGAAEPTPPTHPPLHIPSNNPRMYQRLSR